MLVTLREAEIVLPKWLEDTSQWNSVYVDYHPPFVERLWRQWGDYRVFLHRIHPCRPEEALFHPHPWPSAMKILSGKYEMAVGFGGGEAPPPVATTIILVEGTMYEMTHPDSWHYVRPLEEPAMSLMVAGKPWGRLFPGPETKLQPLSEEQQERIFSFFRQIYKKQ